jgi:hypothetical protein
MRITPHTPMRSTSNLMPIDSGDPTPEMSDCFEDSAGREGDVNVQGYFHVARLGVMSPIDHDGASGEPA